MNNRSHRSGGVRSTRSGTPAGHAGITFVGASGDTRLAGGPDWLAVSPNVLSVGGTTLSVDSSGQYLSEVAWRGSAGGQSQFIAEPSYQRSVASGGKRVTPDPADALLAAGVRLPRRRLVPPGPRGGDGPRRSQWAGPDRRPGGQRHRRPADHFRRQDLRRPGGPPPQGGGGRRRAPRPPRCEPGRRGRAGTSAEAGRRAHPRPPHGPHRSFSRQCNDIGVSSSAPTSALVHIGGYRKYELV